MKELLLMCMEKAHLTVYGKINMQVDGVAMRSL